MEVGDRVKVCSVDQGLINSLRNEELQLVQSMIGNIFAVTEIDEFGYATVEKQVYLSDNNILLQAVSLLPDEMDRQ